MRRGMKSKKDGMILTLHDSMATCPECGSVEWHIVLDGFAFKWEKILRFDCTCCGFQLFLEERP